MRLFIMQLIGYCLALLSSISVALALSATGSRVLAVVGEDPDAYSSFLGSLKERGYATTSLTPEEVSETTLYKFGERMFDHAVILAPNMKQFPKGLGIKIPYIYFCVYYFLYSFPVISII